MVINESFTLETVTEYELDKQHVVDCVVPVLVKFPTSAIFAPSLVAK